MDILAFETEMIQKHIQNMYLEKARYAAIRSGLHASSLLVPPSEWCTRKHVLINTALDEAEPLQVQAWDWIRAARNDDGWKRHERFQRLIQDFGDPVWNKELEGWELDLTHYSEEYELYFSPDVIESIGPHAYLYEIKGMNTDEFNKLTDDLEQAVSVSEAIRKARIQANNYLFFADMEKALLLIDNKNTQHFKVYIIQKDEALFKPYRERALDVKAGTINASRGGGLRILPQRVCSSSDVPLAKKCVMCKKCWKEKI